MQRGMILQRSEACVETLQCAPGSARVLGACSASPQIRVRASFVRERETEEILPFYTGNRLETTVKTVFHV